MNDKTKEIIKWVGVGLTAAGSVALFLGGGSEGYAIEIVGAAFAVLGIIMSIIRGK